MLSPEPGAAPPLSRAGVGMRNFLERLVARTVEATAVRPRVASRYERGPWGDRASGQPAAVENADVDPPATPSWAVASAEAPPGRDPDRRHAVRDRIPTLDRAAAPAAVVGSPDTGVANPPPVEPARTPRTREACSGSRGLTARGGTRAAGARGNRPAAAAGPPGDEQPRRHISPAAPRTRPGPSPAPDLVQVRIGRIDVRATVARPEHPAPAATRAPRARPLSLEAFLDGKRERP